MTELILELYAALSAFATVTFVAFGLARKRKSSSEELQAIEEFDHFIRYRRPELRSSDPRPGP